MNFDFTEHEKKIFIQVQDILTAFLQEYPLDNNSTMVKELLKRLFSTSYCFLKEEENFSAPALMHTMEIIARVSPSLYLSLETNLRLFGLILDTYAPDWMPDFYKGDILGAVALTEETMNIDNDPFETKAVKQGDQFSINGSKKFVINGTVADYIAVVGQLEEHPAIFLVEKNNPGLNISKSGPMMGFEETPIAALTLTDCLIPSTSMLGPFKEATFLKSLRMWENQILMGACLGMMTTSFEKAKTYANTHKTGGKPIIAYQEVAFKLAEMLTLLQTSQLFAYRSISANSKEAESLTLCAKVFCSEAAEKVTGASLQILSGTALSNGYAASQAYLGAKYAQISGTSTEIARVKIGDSALGY